MHQAQDRFEDRRRFYRIDDEVALKYRVVPLAEADAAVRRSQQSFRDKLTIASDFATTSLHMRRALEAVRRDLPEVAAFLDGLNEKIDLLVKLLAASQQDLPDQPTHDVNLSASGISFNTIHPLVPGSLIELKMLMFPSFSCVLTIGEVVRCDRLEEPSSEFAYRVAVDFSHIREDDREVLIRHVLQKQSAMLRDARGLKHPQE